MEPSSDFIGDHWEGGPDALLPRDQLEEADPVALEEALVGQFLPDLPPEAGGGLDGDDSAAGAGQRRVAEPGILVELGQLQALLEGLERALEFIFCGGHAGSSCA